jgi:phenylacetate-CoA ligase
VYVETPPSEMQPGRSSIVLTTLCNRAMPLLRFDTGDLGELDTAPCGCGRHTQQLKIIMGREAEVVQLPSGRRLSPYVLTVLIETLPGVHQYRILHEQPARLAVEVSASNALSSAALEDCRRRLLEVLNEPVQLAMIRVDRLERPRSGKYKVFERRW